MRIATRTTPQAMFPDRQIGAFEEGAEASLVAYDADPLRSLATLRVPKLAIKQGEMIALR
jgi:imidazolonepropionase-like amidohydrolase